jgi:hypothetical protein
MCTGHYMVCQLTNVILEPLLQPRSFAKQFLSFLLEPSLLPGLCCHHKREDERFSKTIVYIIIYCYCTTKDGASSWAGVAVQRVREHKQNLVAANTLQGCASSGILLVGCTSLAYTL